MRSCLRHRPPHPPHRHTARDASRIVHGGPALRCNSSSASSQPAAGTFRLILLRHADSDSAATGVRDHDREISTFGKAQALAVAQLLKDRVGWVPDLVLGSNSKRTKQTLDACAEVIQELADVDAHFYGSLYTVAALDGQTREHIAECLVEVVNEGRHRVVMCVGHNKGWEEAASQLAGRAVKLRTASAALLQCTAASWREALQAAAGGAGGGEAAVKGGQGAAHPGWTLVDVLVPAV